MSDHFNIRRRTLIKALLALGISGPALTGLLHASTQKRILKTIPSSGEQIHADSGRSALLARTLR